MSHHDLILGIDGGGTKTVTWLASRHDPSEQGVVGRGRAGASNLQTVGLSLATSNLEESVEAAFTDAQLSRDRVASACIGLAGAGREKDRAVIQEWAERRNLASRIVVTNDALPVLYAATPDGVGIAVVSGTGSFAFGRDAAGRTARCGGWGPLLGDDGSGYAIAVAGLRAAVRAADGRGPGTTLLMRFREQLKWDDPSDLIPAIYASGVGRAEIAQHACVVFAASETGDRVAADIVHQAAIHLAEMVATVASQLEVPGRPVPLALTGGVLLHRQEFRQQLCDELAAGGLQPDPVATVPEPAVGCLILAATR